MTRILGLCLFCAFRKKLMYSAALDVLKCYTGVTFGGRRVTLENPVAVKVCRRFMFEFLLWKKK